MRCIANVIGLGTERQVYATFSYEHHIPNIRLGKNIKLLVILASEDGLKRVASEHPDVEVRISFKSLSTYPGLTHYF